MIHVFVFWLKYFITNKEDRLTKDLKIVDQSAAAWEGPLF